MTMQKERMGSGFLIAGLAAALITAPVPATALESGHVVALSKARKLRVVADGGAQWCGPHLQLRMIVDADSPDLGNRAREARIMGLLKKPIAASCPQATDASLDLVEGTTPAASFAANAESGWVFAAVAPSSQSSSQPAISGDAPPVQTVMPPAPAAPPDVYGVRLGMTPQEVIAALKAYAPDMAITDNTGNIQQNLGTRFWDSTLTIVGLSSDFAKTTAIINKQNDEDQACFKQKDSESACNEALPPHRYDDDRRAALNDPQVIVAWFSPVAGNEKVIAVSSATYFVKHVPLVTTVVAALKNKYKAPPSLETDDDGYNTTSLDWIYDPRNRLESKEAASAQGAPGLTPASGVSYTCNFTLVDNSRGFGFFGNGGGNAFCPQIEVPQGVTDGDGVRLVAAIDGDAAMRGDMASLNEPDSSPPNPLLSIYLHLLLFDGTAIYKYGDQASHFAAMLQQQQNQQTTTQFQGNAPKL